MKFLVETIGCQQNEYDASRLAIFLKSAGFIKSTAKEAGVIFILACSVRQMAVDRIIGRIRNWQRDGKKIYITACVTDDDKKKFTKKGVTYFKDFDELSNILGLKAISYKLTADSCYVPIMTGCNNFCSYCIVPYTRGREKSRSTNEIIKEVTQLISNFSTVQYGSEKPKIILLGQNVNSYEYGFAELLKKINDLPGDFIISFMSNHPKDMKADVIDAIAKLPKVNKEIHLPLQAGSDKILKAMNRPYTAEEYLRLVESLKSKVPKVKLTTDIIVGFPGETEEDFQQTVKVCKKVGFSLAYINKYSPRKGTASYKLGDPIAWSEKQRRWKILDNLINKNK
ncbi:MAG: MiaB/RimO family radical SAM methylthiotransferase [Candidatus Berkelbacteria bacterium]|nr:MiaB/RimO family radical SAM methylthiotransferase [Candidatus Berkelbacteria bacterium]